MKQSVQVSILGQQFNLKSDESAEQVQRVAAFVEDQVTQVTSSGRAVDSLQAAVLALLNVSAAYLQGQPLPSEVPLPEDRLALLADRIDQALSGD
jgi:cell division protein ZapA